MLPTSVLWTRHRKTRTRNIYTHRRTWTMPGKLPHSCSVERYGSVDAAAWTLRYSDSTGKAERPSVRISTIPRAGSVRFSFACFSRRMHRPSTVECAPGRVRSRSVRQTLTSHCIIASFALHAGFDAGGPQTVHRALLISITIGCQSEQR